MASIFAAPRKRARLISPLALAGLAALTLLALRLLYPEADLLRLLVAAPRGNPLTVSYLANLHSLDPTNPQTAVLLARARLEQGRTAEALALASLHARSADPELRRAAMRVRLDVLREEQARAAHTPGEREAAAALAGSVQASMNEAWSRDELLLLAADAAAAQDFALEQRIYSHVSNSVTDPAWLEAAARRYVARGEYRFAARLFFDARRHAKDARSARDLYLEGVRTLQSGNLPQEALATAEAEIGPLKQDEEILLELARLGLAAGRPDVSARYMRQILFAPRKTSLWLDIFAAYFLSRAHAAAPVEITRPYDPKLYQLAYEVFLANGDVEAAYQVAHAAVAQVPDDAAWRERLARAAEWSRRPAEALAQWRWLSDRTGAEDAWQGVLRIAPGLGEDAALLPALRRLAEGPAARESDLRALVATWERIGHPEEALAWLETRWQKGGSPIALELAADLADRMGRRDQAIALNLELIERGGPPSVERLIRIATLQVLAARYAEAHALLRRFREQVGADARAYWDLLGDIAWMLQEDDSAIQAYRNLTARREIEAGDLDRLVTLLRERQPQEAARLALMGYERFHTAGLLLQALELLWEQKDLASMKRIYAGLRTEDEARFAQTPYFFTLRSQYRQQTGDPRGARADLERALAIAPENAELRQAMVWLLIDTRDLPALRAALLQGGAAAAADRNAWAAQASGWVLLGEPKRALPYFARLVQASPRDYLWLTAYADALEQDGQLGAADRVRRYAWAEVRTAAHRADAFKDQRLRETWARYALARSPGDPALAVIRDLMRLDDAKSDAPAQKERGAATKELVLGWLISTEQHENAKTFLWLNYGRKLAQPGWGAVSVALAEGDAEAAAKLLAERPQDIPYRDRVEAARLAKQLRQAQTYAFEAQERHPDDDILHLQLSQTLLEGANRITGGAAYARRGVIESRPRELAADVWVTPRLRLAAEWREASQRTIDPLVLTGVPAHDRELRVTARRLLDDGWMEVGVGQRDGFAESTAARFKLYQSWGRRLSTLLTAARNERTLDSSALAVAGMRDELSMRALYTLSKSEYLTGQLWGARYRSQNGIALGTASGYDIEAGHRVRIEYPDVTLRVGTAQLWSQTQGSGDEATAALSPTGVNPGPAFFVPAGSRRYGYGASIGETARENWTRAWRPYAGLDRTRNSITGEGYNARFGLRGSLLGHDQLHLYWTRALGGGASNDSILEYGVRYEYFFDRF